MLSVVCCLLLFVCCMIARSSLFVARRCFFVCLKSLLSLVNVRCSLCVGYVLLFVMFSCCLPFADCCLFLVV